LLGLSSEKRVAARFDARMILRERFRKLASSSGLFWYLSLPKTERRVLRKKKVA